jgi:hypothetical protein
MLRFVCKRIILIIIINYNYSTNQKINTILIRVLLGASIFKRPQMASSPRKGENDPEEGQEWYLH